MDFVALSLFTLTMLLIYWRPFRLPLWVFSTLGAVGVYCLNVVSLGDIWRVWAMVWDSTLTLIGLILLTFALEKLGFFTFLAVLLLRILQSSQMRHIQSISTARFYIFLVLFSAFLSTFFANDGAILILTPLIITLFKAHTTKVFFTPLVVFLLLVSFVSDFASNPFVISNLTNIITAQFFEIPSLRFSTLMFLPQFFVILGSLGFWLVVKRFVPPTLTFTHFQSNISISTIAFCFALLGLLLVGILFAHTLGAPLSSFTLLCVFLALSYGKIKGQLEIFPCLKNAPLSIVLFSLGLFVVVFGLKNGGALQILNDNLSLFVSLSQEWQIVSMGFASGIGSSVINNLPMVMFGNLALADFAPHLQDSMQSLVMAHLLGCNIGSKLTPIGSLATLLWLESLRIHGIHIGFMHYMVVAFVVTLPVLLFALLGLIVGYWIG
ncbi:arsenic transporter [Helicobacter sp. MIT 21-1697]|uniref:arsenic transporter n=1 Tax=Helicobacter sp. MIT 21-1697 TaxID=2993733 RepID=UPI00224B3597|nr:arsenic transporter [Helicobacter sp. MIT 21-1697]MCX2717436.1 arsenic transporter [Helicobacter sp. MIT 21-1697]